MSDLISRKAAIDAILHITNCKSVRELFEYNQEHHLTEMWSGGVNDAIDAVIGVESAIDNNVGTKLSTNLASLGTDCISRQAAIDALRKLREEDIEDYGCEIPEGFNQDHLDRATFAIKQLPPIQPKRETATVSVGMSKGGVTMWYECEACGEPVDQGDTFCSGCGRRLIHE